MERRLGWLLDIPVLDGKQYFLQQKYCNKIVKKGFATATYPRLSGRASSLSSLNSQDLLMAISDWLLWRLGLGAALLLYCRLALRSTVAFDLTFRYW